jgi:D-glycero-D-manno-heptose 1,7-bisphosphate phosphatase
MSAGEHAAVFVDRDGTMIREVGHLYRQDQLEILPGVPAGLRLLRDKGYKVVVVTNQSVVARGRLTEAVLAEIHGELLRRLARAGAEVDGLYYCPHHPSEGFAPYKMICDCRKPNTGLIRRAAAELGLVVEHSYVIGDQSTDMELAARSGAKGIWIAAGTERTALPSGANHVVQSLWEAARWIAPRTVKSHSGRVVGSAQ